MTSDAAIRRRSLLLPLLLSLVALPGCVALGAAAIGAGVVAAVSEDTARADLVANPLTVYDWTLERLQAGGKVTTADESALRIEGELEGSGVEVRIRQVGEFVRFEATVRKLAGTLPDLDLAERLAREARRAFP